jgi:hypothetical protein
MLRWDEDKPVNSSGDKWKGVGCRVEDAEPGAVLSRRVLAGWRQESLNASLPGLGLATMVRVVEMHNGVSLQRVG